MKKVLALFGFVVSQNFNRYDTSECIGVYGPSQYMGSSAKIEVNIKPKVKQGMLAVAVFRFEDRRILQTMQGIPDYLLCSQEDVEAKVCLRSEINKFHIKEGTKSQSPILNELINWSEADASPYKDLVVKQTYNVTSTGYYCIYISSNQLEEEVDFDSEFIVYQSYGKLPAIFYPALPFFMTLSIAYMIIGVIWMTLSFLQWRSLLPIQHYVSGVIAFLVVEMAFNYGFFENYNLTGRISPTLLVFVAILNAARFGVVKHTLGSTMNACLTLACVHFIAGAVYSSNLMLANDVNSTVVFFLAIPLSLSMTIFYMWTMSGLQDTMKHLEDRRQGIKLLMYKRLWWILCISIVLLFGIFVANSINMSHRYQDEWVANQWKWRWMLLDGSMNILYFCVFVTIAYLWMPTINNERYGLDQLPTSDFDDAVVLTSDNAIKMRNINRDSHDEDTETADEILAWAEENIKM